ncbi:DUF6169 family protein [Flavobacterium sp. KACC 22761]|uniref:DUF6169 family protein n=1 Tax=Flavobacterium sp. KACC 22761 TaxID=3092665 RepID=UPI002A750D28|nr:DUF6169 family protein [Flavobacterium sp. KACC 22761]WPO80283.1 DUF6169 family protein [Flavobacterium sp. KACC 22761]
MSKQYNYTFNSDSGYYTFLTKRQIEYRVAFYEDFTLATCIGDGLELGNIYQITIDRISTEPAPFDLFVSETIKNIITTFFENTQDALIYICDDNDKKAFQRFATFERWYNKSNMTNYIIKLNNIIEFDSGSEIIKLYTSLMYHKENANLKNIEEAFNNISNTLNGEKL